MANISKIKLPNDATTHTIKDSTARSSITKITNKTTKLAYGDELSISGSDLSLLDPNDNVLSTVTLPGGNLMYVEHSYDNTLILDKVYKQDITDDTAPQAAKVVYDVHNNNQTTTITCDGSYNKLAFVFGWLDFDNNSAIPKETNGKSYHSSTSTWMGYAHKYSTVASPYDMQDPFGDIVSIIYNLLFLGSVNALSFWNGATIKKNGTDVAKNNFTFRLRPIIDSASDYDTNLGYIKYVIEAMLPVTSGDTVVIDMGYGSGGIYTAITHQTDNAADQIYTESGNSVKALVNYL